MSQNRPDIILLVLDTQRADRMSLYGYPKKTTRTLDEISTNATVWDWAISPGQWTIPSHASLFTGLYPTVHQTTQSFTTLPPGIPTTPELLQQNGYHTVGFCNNPLVGVLDNGLRRGFDAFYNYGATFPDVPRMGRDKGLRWIQREFQKLLKRFATPIERSFGHSPLLLKLATLPILVPLWSRLVNFKGNTLQSLRDVTDYLRYHHTNHTDRPLFMFINMMETHLPYYPPSRIVEKWVPYYREDTEARHFIEKFNTQTYRWIAPMMEPFTSNQQKVLGDVYDAEMAFQDRQLHKVFSYLKKSGRLENMMVVIVSDHGESHGEHEFMGHGFAIYNELVRVPLMIRYPAIYPQGKRVKHTVSTRRIFHSILEAAGIDHHTFGRPTHELSLLHSLNGKEGEPEGEEVISEAYPPLNFINVMEMSSPSAVARFRVKETRKAIFDGMTKLMTIGDRTDELFDMQKDPKEDHNLLDNPVGYENQLIDMEHRLEDYSSMLAAQRDGTQAGGHIDYSDNPELLERLRGLGYIE
jgi:uncharacterized sulfatase